MKLPIGTLIGMAQRRVWLTADRNRRKLAKSLSKPWFKKAELGDTCGRCGEKLYGHAVRMLELDQRDWTYHDRRDVPEERSQGWHPFGLKCAKKILEIKRERK